MKRCLSWMAAVLLTTGLLTACGGGGTAAQSDDELTFSASLGPRTWDPHPENRAFVYGWYSLVYDGLMTTDAQGAIVPGLASDWTLTGESLELTLVDDVEFSDGTPFDGEAVKWNIEKAKGQAGTAAVLQVIDEVEVVDPTHVVFHLSRPAPNMVEQLAGFPGLMVSPAVSQADLENGAPAGTGPYVLNRDETQKDTKYVFDKSETSWLADDAHFERMIGTVSADEVARANALRSDRADVAYISPAQAKSVTAPYELATAPAYIQSFIVLDAGGEKTSALAEEKVRQAIALAINRDVFVENVNGGYGQAVDQLFTEGIGHVEGYEAPERDVEQAKKLMAEAGVDKVTIATSTWGSFSLGNEALKSMLAEIGVDLELKTVAPGQDIVGITGGEYGATYTYVPDRHPHSAYAKYLAEQAPYNPYKHVDPEVEEAVARALAAVGDDEALTEAYADMMRRAYETGWIVPIAQYETLIGYSSETVKDVVGWEGVTGFFYLRDVKPA